jgi:hypothetical protein
MAVERKLNSCKQALRFLICTHHPEDLEALSALVKLIDELKYFVRNPRGDAFLGYKPEGRHVALWASAHQPVPVEGDPKMMSHLLKLHLLQSVDDTQAWSVKVCNMDFI